MLRPLFAQWMLEHLRKRVAYEIVMTRRKKGEFPDFLSMQIVNQGSKQHGDEAPEWKEGVLLDMAHQMGLCCADVSLC